MYCPRCGAGYRNRFAECPDCHVALLHDTAPSALHSRAEPVVVFESNDRIPIALAKGSLEDAGIPFWMEGDETAARLVLGPIMFPTCRFLVPKGREAEARDLLEPLRSPRKSSR
jgi:hypothetical protein